MTSNDLKTTRKMLSAYVAGGRKINGVMLHLSTQCNSRCRNCYRLGDGEGVTRGLEEALELIRGFTKKGFKVIPEMAELTLNTAPLLAAYKETGYTQLSTNGESILEHPWLLEKLRDNGITQLRITLNHPSVHKLWTGRDRERAVQVVKASVSGGFYTVVNSIVSKSTISKLDKICEEALSLGAEEVNFLNFMYTGRAEKMAREVLSLQDIQQFYKYLDELRLRYDKNVLHIDRHGTFGPGPKPEGCLGQLVEQGKFCWAGEGPHGRYFYVEADNNIYPCMALCTPELKVGELVDGEIVINSNPLKGFDRKDCYCLQRGLKLTQTA